MHCCIRKVLPTRLPPWLLLLLLLGRDWQPLLSRRPLPGSAVSAAAGTVKPLMSLTTALLQLQPVALMRIGEVAAAAGVAARTPTE
jgi:hypothetical protein